MNTDNVFYGLPARARIGNQDQWRPARLVARLHSGRYLVAVGSQFGGAGPPFVLDSDDVRVTRHERPAFPMPRWAWDWEPRRAA